MEKQTLEEIEKLRAERAEKAKKRAERSLKWAESHEKKSETLGKQTTELMSLIPLGQPILVGHHSERKARADHERINNKFRQQFEHDNAAKYHREKAENILLFSTRVRGDAEREREMKRKEMDEKIKVGQVVYDFAYGAAEVLKINKKTYTLKFKTFTTTRDKIFVKL
jgi:hypothetical protein